MRLDHLLKETARSFQRASPVFTLIRSLNDESWGWVAGSTPAYRPFLGDGGIAQLGERLLCKQEVIGSIPFASTTHQVVCKSSTLHVKCATLANEDPSVLRSIFKNLEMK